MQHFPNARLIRFDALLVVVARAIGAIAVAVLAIAAGVRTFTSHWPMQLVYGAFAFLLLHLALSVFHMLLAVLERCPSCGKHPLVQGFSPVHPASIGQAKAEGWSGAVWSIVHRRQFTCIHCGTAFTCQNDA